MAANFKFELVSPERVLLSTEIQQAEVPGADGAFTVLSGHAPVISTLLPGVVRVTMTDGIKNVFVKGGFVEVTPTSLTVLAESAFIVDEVDPRQLEKELDAAQQDMKGADSDAARMRVGRAIDELKALVKLKQG
jgi:F-type H+-transporting ATPase subunit epsilon